MWIPAAPDHACAVLVDGTARCWGGNIGGALGNGTTSASTQPVTVTGLSPTSSISTSAVSCALLVDGTARCWGPNSTGALGDGGTTNRHTPVPVVGL